MPRKFEYNEEHTNLKAYRIWYAAMADLDWSQPVIIVGRKKGTSELYAASTTDGKNTNSLLAKAMNFMKRN